MAGKVCVERDTAETRIRLELDLDGSGVAQVSTGIGFLDHMLVLFAKHGFFDIVLQAKGDLEVDAHHTAEDVGIVLGECIKQALGDKTGRKRYGHALLPMDEALVMCAVDLSGRAHLEYDLHFSTARLGALDTELVKEFFGAVCKNAGMTLHIRQFGGENNHHIAEAAFKAFAKALDDAVQPELRLNGVLSTKGVLA